MRRAMELRREGWRVEPSSSRCRRESCPISVVRTACEVGRPKKGEKGTKGTCWSNRGGHKNHKKGWSISARDRLREQGVFRLEKALSSPFQCLKGLQRAGEGLWTGGNSFNLPEVMLDWIVGRNSPL